MASNTTRKTIILLWMQLVIPAINVIVVYLISVRKKQQQKTEKNEQRALHTMLSSYNKMRVSLYDTMRYLYHDIIPL